MLYSKKSLTMLCVVCFVLLPLFLLGDEHKLHTGKADFSKRFLKNYGDHYIKVRQTARAPKAAFPASKTVEKCAERFYKALEYLPESLVRKTNLKYVTFLRYIELNGERAAGVACGDTILLVTDFSEKTLFHEFFHIFDPHRNSEEWTKLNDEKFIYTGSKFFESHLTRKEERQVRKNLRKKRITEDFVTRYAMSYEHEDRAETFAFMITEGKHFMKRARNPVIKAKMEYIMNLFIERDLLDKDFWEKHFSNKFQLKHRYYKNKTDEDTSGGKSGKNNNITSDSRE